METLLLMAAVGVYFGIIAMIGWDAWDQIKRHHKWR